MAQVDYTSQTLNSVTQTLVNVSGGTEIGSSLPPPQNGEFRIPFVTNLRLGPVSSFFGGTQFTLLWDQPDTTESISHYNVYARGALQNNQAPLGPYSSVVSPAVFRITPSQAGIITFFVQTQLQNGNVSDIDRSPSIAAFATPPQIKTGDVTPGTIFPAPALSTVFTITNYAATASDACVMVDAAAGPIAITCPPNPPVDGQVFLVKKCEAGANAVTVSPAAGEFMETGAPIVIPGGSRGALFLLYRLRGTGGTVGDATWQIISKF